MVLNSVIRKHGHKMISRQF